MPIFIKAEEKMRLAQPKTQLFEKICILGLGKKMRSKHVIFMDRRRSIRVSLVQLFVKVHNEKVEFC